MSLDPIKVLIADDEEMLRRLICLALTRAGFVTCAASDGVEALEAYQRESPDIVLLDIVMPRREGIWTLLGIRRLNPHAKIIAMSGGAQLSALDLLGAAGTLGANAILQKPFRMADVVASVQRLAGVTLYDLPAGPRV